eukprot:351985-Chlamydomonas_euryale.AAC.3
MPQTLVAPAASAVAAAARGACRPGTAARLLPAGLGGVGYATASAACLRVAQACMAQARMAQARMARGASAPGGCAWATWPHGGRCVATAAAMRGGATSSLKYLIGVAAAGGAAAMAAPDSFQMAYLIPLRLARDVYTAAVMVAGAACCRQRGSVETAHMACPPAWMVGGDGIKAACFSLHAMQANTGKSGSSRSIA